MITTEQNDSIRFEFRWEEPNDPVMLMILGREGTYAVIKLTKLEAQKLSAELEQKIDQMGKAMAHNNFAVQQRLLTSDKE